MGIENSNNIVIIKSSGDREPFSQEKYTRSLKRAGLTESEIDDVLLRVTPQLYNGMTTRELYVNTFNYLKDKKRACASRYSLKYAIKLLGPSGFPFEKLVANILKAEGYTVKTDQIMQGKCVKHEIDIVAEKDGKYTLVECKFHIQAETRSAIQTALYVKARFDDIAATQTEPLGGNLIATNTEFTTEAIAYSECVGLGVLAWGYPKGRGLDSLIEKYNLYPITALTTLKTHERAMLLDAGIVLCKELVENANSLSLPKNVIEEVKGECHALCSIN